MSDEKRVRLVGGPHDGAEFDMATTRSRSATEATVLRDFAEVTEGAAPAADGTTRTDGARAVIFGAASLARRMADQITDGPVTLSGMAAHVRTRADQ